MYTKIESCRLCLNPTFDVLFDLGMQSMTGVFPRSASDEVPQGPLELVKCRKCDLVQLAHNYQLSVLYGPTYGYRSGLNRSMVAHLTKKTQDLLKRFPFAPGSVFLDIGSNDATLLRSYPDGYQRVGIDPMGVKLKNYYPESVSLIPEFFSSYAVRKVLNGRKASLVTSIAMFYDLEDPVGFASEVAETLADDGVWAFEQSYLPLMLKQVAYDTICHEHLEYYALKQLRQICDEAGLKIIHIEFNDCNGGSIYLNAAKKDSPYDECVDTISTILCEEERIGLSTLEPYRRFRGEVELHREQLLQTLNRIAANGETVFGYGASTKGNVLLQYCGLSPTNLRCIAEVNEEKFGAFTPGTGIPILSEREARSLQPDYFLVLPWHFRNHVIERESEFLQAGGQLLFPLPRVDIVSRRYSS